MKSPLRQTAILLALLLACGSAAGQQRGPSTPEERKRFLEVTRKLETSPLDESLRPEMRWAFRWLTEVPDIGVTVCADAMPWMKVKKYKYSPELTMQYTLGSGAFVIEHPDKAADSSAANLAGLESALRAYQAILKQDPKAKSSELDPFVDKMNKGELAGYMQGKCTK